MRVGGHEYNRGKPGDTANGHRPRTPENTSHAAEAEGGMYCGLYLRRIRESE